MITVDLDKLAPADTTFSGIVAQIDALANIAATLTSDNKIRLQSGSSDIRFSFAHDTSGFLAAAGLNAFFSGSTADDLAVNPSLAQNTKWLSGAQSNPTGDNANALAFIALRDLASIDGTTTFEDFFQGVAGDVGVQTAAFKGRFENQALLAQQLENQRERISGVNIDEEAVHMIQFQRAFQASARFIGVIDDLLDTLINGI
jgi:flagellar hook-associated protein 1 FlgK